MKQTIIIPETHINERLDQALAKLLPQYSRTQLQEWIESGHILLNGNPGKAKLKVKGGETVTIDAVMKPQPDWVAQDIPLPIVYEDEALIIINKPVGLVVHPGAGNADQTLLNALLHHFPELQALPRAGILHRLDKDTSGLLVIARTPNALKNLSHQLKKRTLLREYQAIVYGDLISGGTTTDPSEAYKDETPQQIYTYGKTALKDKSYGEAIKRFEALDVQYPFGAETEQAQLYLIYAYYMKEEYPLSVAAADRFIRIHPTNPNVDYAYYMRGMADYYQNLGFLERFFSIDLATRDLTQIQKSYNDFNELVTRFPNSKYAPAAHQYMIYLRNIMAAHELQVAQYYYDRKAYVAAANRASGLVAHFQGAPETVDGLILMAKSYHKLGMTKLEQDTLTVLKYNYPNAKVDLNS